MKTLFCAQKPPLYLPKPSPWQPRNPIIHPKTMQNINHTTKWKLHANAKGFGSSIPATIKQSVNKQNSNKNSNNDDEDIPMEVFYRMIVRILVSVLVPMVLGLVSLQYFGVVKEQHLWDIPLWLPLLTSFFTFGASALGIAYGTLSTSLDIEKKGSFLGLEEAQQNWVEMWKEENES